MKTRDARLTRIRQHIKPPGGPLKIVWIDVETGMHTVDGETMPAAEYNRRYPEKGPVISWPENEGEL